MRGETKLSARQNDGDREGDCRIVNLAEHESHRDDSSTSTGMNRRPFFMEFDADLAADPANYCLPAEGRFPD